MNKQFAGDNLVMTPRESNMTTVDYAAIQGFIYWSEAVIQPTILTFGFLTNLASVLVLQKVKLATTFRTCLMALALSDLCATSTGFLSIVLEVAIFQGKLPHGHYHGAVVSIYALYFTYLMFMCTSGSIVILVAVVRNLIVLKPLRARAYFTRNRTKWICFWIFLATLLVYMPVSTNVIWQSCYNDTVEPFCIGINETLTLESLETISNKYLFTVSVLYGPIMLLIYIACVASIWVTLKKSTRELSNMTLKRSKSQLDSTKKRRKATGRITRTLLMILIIDIICTMPTIIYGIYLLIHPKETIFDDSALTYEVFDVIAEIFLACRPAYNFWLYMCQHEEFRQSFSDMVHGASKACARIPNFCRGLPLPCRHRKSFDLRPENVNVEQKQEVKVNYDDDFALNNVHLCPDAALEPCLSPKQHSVFSTSDSFMASRY